MLDLVEKVQQMASSSASKTGRLGGFGLTKTDNEFDSVPHVDVCVSCIVPGGCDDLDPRCQLAARHRIRADSRPIKSRAGRYHVIATDCR